MNLVVRRIWRGSQRILATVAPHGPGGSVAYGLILSTSLIAVFMVNARLGETLDRDVELARLAPQIRAAGHDLSLQVLLVRSGEGSVGAVHNASNQLLQQFRRWPEDTLVRRHPAIHAMAMELTGPTLGAVNPPVLSDFLSQMASVSQLAAAIDAGATSGVTLNTRYSEGVLNVMLLVNVTCLVGLSVFRVWLAVRRGRNAPNFRRVLMPSAFWPIRKPAAGPVL